MDIKQETTVEIQHYTDRATQPPVWKQEATVGDLYDLRRYICTVYFVTDTPDYFQTHNIPAPDEFIEIVEEMIHQSLPAPDTNLQPMDRDMNDIEWKHFLYDNLRVYAP